MCAIAGLWLRGEPDPQTLHALATKMAMSMARRGPDGQGVWVDPNAGLALSHRRLAVLDLSDAAAQPMVDCRGEHVLVFNGEIYNHRQWRGEGAIDAEGSTPASHGDTATLLAALPRWGAQRTCKATHGMFAWAWFDVQSQRLTLARDRFGKKPLVVASGPWGMAFASQVSALLQLPMVVRTVDEKALDHYLRWGHAPVDRSLIRGIERVAPGEIQVWEKAQRVGRVQYWQAEQVAQVAAQVSSPTGRITHAEQALAELDQVVREAVRDRLLSDAPLGAFLSGGIDSSLVVALMQQEGATRTRSFSVGFDDAQYDESAHALAIARALGTDHQNWMLSARDARELMPDLADICDEPLGDASQLPTTWLALKAAESVKVVLTGDGGDEAFGGYPRYRHALGGWAFASRLPQPLKNAIASGLGAIRPALWNRLASLVPTSIRPTLPASKADKVQRWLRATDDTQRTASLMQRWDPRALRTGNSPAPRSAQGEVPLEDLLSPSERMQLAEMQDGLSADLLAKMDRATMWASVEARSPLLDDRVITLAWRLHPSLKAEGPRSKEILRQLLACHLNPALFDRPKRGFSVPLAHWMRHELREPVNDLLESLQRHTQGRWHTDPIRQAWSAQLQGTSHEGDRLWSLVALEAWRRRWNLELP